MSFTVMGEIGIFRVETYFECLLLVWDYLQILTRNFKGVIHMFKLLFLCNILEESSRM